MDPSTILNASSDSQVTTYIKTTWWEALGWYTGFWATPATPGTKKVPVYVMMPLEFGLQGKDALAPHHDLLDGLRWIKEIGVEGIMVDVWWGVVESQPKQYDFSRYDWLVQVCKELGLQMLATMSFHECGGNVGDSCYIPLPGWVVEDVSQAGGWYQDHLGHMDREYISLSVDELPVCKGRTPVQCYRDVIEAFCEHFKQHLGSTIVEMQVGLGPCGELRYPSYRMSKGLWNFPGMGEFQCYDKHMLKMLEVAVKEYEFHGDKTNWHVPPVTNYNDTLATTQFFKSLEQQESVSHGTNAKTLEDPNSAHYTSERGKFFLEWYSNLLLKHLDVVMSQAYEVAAKYPSPLHLSIKISGIHWHHATPARGAEACAGYYNTNGVNFYDKVSQSLAKYHATFNFTCLEMWTWNQPYHAYSDPEHLVQQVLECTRRHKIRFSGENAIEKYTTVGFHQVAKVMKHATDVADGMSWLRLSDKMLTPHHKKLMARFVQRMSHL